MWILSHVPSAIALSLFILKSSNLEKINDTSYPNLSCGNVTLLIAFRLKLQCGHESFVPFFTSILCILRFTHMQSLTAYFFI